MDSWVLQKLGGRDVSLLPTDELEVPVRVANMLKVEGIRTVGQLATKSEAELLRNPNFGRRSLEQLKQALDELGVELESSEILDMEQQMKRAMARARAAKVAYAEAALEVQRIAKRLADTDLEEIIPCES
jgi:CRISPR/Cas system CMR-associated protein Cmr5 small subunit